MPVLEFLDKNKTIIMPQPPYLLDLAPTHFILLTKLKTPMKGKRLATIEKIKEKSKQMLLAIPNSAFQKCFKDWKKEAGISKLYLRGVTLKGTR